MHSFHNTTGLERSSRGAHVGLLCILGALATALLLVALGGSYAQAACPQPQLHERLADDCGGGAGGGGTGGGGLAALVAGPQTDYDLGQGIHMTTSVRVSRTYGRIDGHTRTWTTWWGVGGHGAVGLYLLDASGNVIGASNAHIYGVDAKSVFWGRHDRTDDWTDTVPAEISSRTSSVIISHTSTTVDNFQHILDDAKKKGCAIFQVLGKDCPFK
jgi:hypothetical protein